MKFLILIGLVLAACGSSTSTVGVVTEVKGLRLQGSGTVIYSDEVKGTYVLTAGHAIGPSGSLPPWRAHYYVSLPHSTPEAEYVAHYTGMTDAGNCDVGILHIKSKVDTKVAEFSQDGDLLGGKNLVVKAYRVGGETKIDAHLDGSRLSTRPDIEHGDSGSAVFVKGKIVALISGMPNGDDDAVFIRWKAITQFMKDNGIGWLLTKRSN